MNPYKREAEEDFTADGRGEGNVTIETNWNGVTTRCGKRQGTEPALGGNAS